MKKLLLLVATLLTGCAAIQAPLSHVGYFPAAKLGNVEYFSKRKLDDTQKAKLLENIQTVQGEFESHWLELSNLKVYLTDEDGRNCEDDTKSSVVTPLGPRLNVPELYHELVHKKINDPEHKHENWSIAWNIVNGSLQNRMD